MGNIEVQLGSMPDKMDEAFKRSLLNARLAETPRRMRIHGQVAADANGFGVITFDNVPSQGWFWLVRKLAIGGATPATTAAGQADVFVSSTDYRQFTTLAQCGTQDWLDQFASLPLANDYSSGELPVQFQEKLFVVISGGTTDQVYHVSGVIEAWQEAAYRTAWDS
jgi:hypothetical protein